MADAAYDYANDPNYDEATGQYYNEETGLWEDPVDPNMYAPPDGAILDEDGRLLANEPVNTEFELEDYNTFVSAFNSPWMAALGDADASSKYVWPEIDFCVNLQRIDVFELENPRCQQACNDKEESRRVRVTPNWSPVFSFMLLNMPTQFTRLLEIWSTGPPRRHKYVVNGKKNSRDTSTWVYRSTVNGYIGADRIPGALDLYVDFQDSPDRYYISLSPTADLGLRRLYRFAGYPVTQYFILEKVVISDALESEGGSGLTVRIEKGPFCYMRKGWKIAGSFFAFDKELYGSNKYTVYSREDPFHRINVAIGPISHENEWTKQHEFYAFDIPLAGTCTLTLQHCVRSIYNAAANVSRHRLTVEDPRLPWEFRMYIYAFPADLEDCSLSDEPVRDGKKIGDDPTAPK
jgi:hypothetical protein